LKFRITILLAFLSLNLSAQYTLIDSLKYQFTELSHDTAVANNYMDLCKAYKYLSIDTSLMYGELAYEIYTQEGQKKKQIKALLSIAHAHRTLGDEAQQLGSLEKGYALAVSLKDTFLMGRVNNDIGVRYLDVKEFEKSLVYFQRSYDWSKISGDDLLYQNAVNNLGVINSLIGRFKESLVYFNEAKDLAREANDVNGEVMGLVNIGKIHLDLEENDSALKVLKEVIARKDVTNKYYIGYSYGLLATIYLRNKNYEQSLKKLNESIEIGNKYKYKDLSITGETEKIVLLIELDRNEEAIKLGKSLLDSITEPQFEYLIPIVRKHIAAAYENSENYKEALFWEKSMLF